MFEWSATRSGSPLQREPTSAFRISSATNLVPVAFYTKRGMRSEKEREALSSRGLGNEIMRFLKRPPLGVRNLRDNLTTGSRKELQ